MPGPDQQQAQHQQCALHPRLRQRQACQQHAQQEEAQPRQQRMEAVEQQVARHAGPLPQAGILQRLPVPAFAVVPLQQRPARTGGQAADAGQQQPWRRTQPQHRQCEVHRVVVQDIGWEQCQIEQPQHQQEQCASPGLHAGRPPSLPLRGQHQAQPGQRNESGRGLAFQQTSTMPASAR
ncbi:hypothetical protein G6F46_013939 [Rhizopus delemar]|nr:hypothetical protein G6F46_013939 [Rhizopus delemar]